MSVLQRGCENPSSGRREPPVSAVWPHHSALQRESELGRSSRRRSTGDAAKQTAAPRPQKSFHLRFTSAKSTHLPPQVLRSRSTFPTPSRSLLEFLDLEGKEEKKKKKVFPLSSLHTKSPQPIFICPELYLLQLFIWKCNQSPFRQHWPLRHSCPPLCSQKPQAIRPGV